MIENLRRLYYWLFWHGNLKEGNRVEVQRLPAFNEKGWPLWVPDLPINAGDITEIVENNGSDGYTVKKGKDWIILPGYVLKKI